jgi:microcystin-dependent protein
MAKKAYVNDGTNWVELASSNTDLSGYLLESSASTTYATKTELNNIDLSSASAAAVAAIVDSAPSTLNTLNELAAALGDDANFATTITEMIANKLTSVPGIINQFAGSGSAAPTGWLFCDGQEVLITTYQNLYNSLTSNGTTFPYGTNTNGSGGAGSTHFRIPNFKGRVPVGKDSSQTEFDLLGETGGAKTHTLTIAEMPNHRHAFTVLGTPGSGNLTPSLSDNPPVQTGFTGYEGGGEAHNNLQPYITINYIIKT